MAEDYTLQLKKYKCHIEVRGFKIGAITSNPDGSAALYGENGFVWPVGMDYVEQYQPEIGGYFVVYESGCRSYVPGHVFEKGYSLKGDN